MRVNPHADLRSLGCCSECPHRLLTETCDNGTTRKSPRTLQQVSQPTDIDTSLQIRGHGITSYISWRVHL
ncbi:hypothetical protein PISMIDRAFT_690416 [Pisolithus microcarpus 441]|uniref:Uncharacterized protein n=1 Tax=Pisolithus microcarpus 441 TaxID=765257 RepID=A0A0C9YM15_9AGAM|nr:hypothetical protein PISMIDRAFT_690416 [Pisolithus microcarpus 441]